MNKLTLTTVICTLLLGACSGGSSRTSAPQANQSQANAESIESNTAEAANVTIPPPSIGSSAGGGSGGFPAMENGESFAIEDLLSEGEELSTRTINGSVSFPTLPEQSKTYRYEVAAKPQATANLMSVAPIKGTFDPVTLTYQVSYQAPLSDITDRDIQLDIYAYATDQAGNQTLEYFMPNSAIIPALGDTSLNKSLSNSPNSPSAKTDDATVMNIDIVADTIAAQSINIEIAETTTLAPLTIQHPQIVGNTLYLSANIANHCDGDNFTLYIPPQLAIATQAKLALEQTQNGANCRQNVRLAFSADLTTLLYDYMHRQGNVPGNITAGASELGLNLSNLVTYTPAPTPLSSTRIYGDTVGCHASNTCIHHVTFNTNGTALFDVTVPDHLRSFPQASIALQPFTAAYWANQDESILYSGPGSIVFGNSIGSINHENGTISISVLGQLGNSTLYLQSSE